LAPEKSFLFAFKEQGTRGVKADNMSITEKKFHRAKAKFLPV